MFKICTRMHANYDLSSFKCRKKYSTVTNMNIYVYNSIVFKD